MDNLRRLGSEIPVAIQPDESGFTGRECPQPNCEGYFKVEFGTGLKGKGLPCHCPYCGQRAGHDQFWTKAQIEYAKSVAKRKITDAVYQDLKRLEFDHQPKGAFGIGVSMKVKRDHRVPIHSYREKQLETEVVCASCTLRYSIYGVFAYCPDCGQHNSHQILEKNLEVIGKMLDLSNAAERELSEKLIENALEDCVSTFDAFGRELCRVSSKTAVDPVKANRVRFQDLETAKSSIQILFRVDLSAPLTADEWQSAVRGFQKRHLLAHKLGVVDRDYIAKTGDAKGIIGRKITVGALEVRCLLQMISKLARNLSERLTEARELQEDVPAEDV